MAVMITNRHEVLVPRTVGPDRLSVMRGHCEGLADFKLVKNDLESGQVDIEDLKSKISSKTAAVYIENPTHLGFVGSQGEEISQQVSCCVQEAYHHGAGKECCQEQQLSVMHGSGVLCLWQERTDVPARRILLLQDYAD